MLEWEIFLSHRPFSFILRLLQRPGEALWTVSPLVYFANMFWSQLGGTDAEWVSGQAVNTVNNQWRGRDFPGMSCVAHGTWPWKTTLGPLPFPLPFGSPASQRAWHQPAPACRFHPSAGQHITADITPLVWHPLSAAVSTCLSPTTLRSLGSALMEPEVLPSWTQSRGYKLEI